VTDAGLRAARRQEKDRVAREHLLDAAEQVFGRKGFHAATLKEVAERAEFSVGAIYGFFEGKDDLFAQVLERQGDALLLRQQEAVAGARSALDKLHRLVEVQLDYFRERPDFYRLFQRELGGATWSLRASLNEQGYERYRAVLEFEAVIFAEGVAAGDLRAEDPEVLAALFSGLMAAYIAQWVHGADESGDSVIDGRYPLHQVHDLIDRAFAAPDDQPGVFSPPMK
jgi:TetR/AcrR family transcriptional regulator